MKTRSGILKKALYNAQCEEIVYVSKPCASKMKSKSKGEFPGLPPAPGQRLSGPGRLVWGSGALPAAALTPVSHGHRLQQRRARGRTRAGRRCPCRPLDTCTSPRCSEPCSSLPPPPPPSPPSPHHLPFHRDALFNHYSCREQVHPPREGATSLAATASPLPVTSTCTVPSSALVPGGHAHVFWKMGFGFFSNKNLFKKNK